MAKYLHLSYEGDIHATDRKRLKKKKKTKIVTIIINYVHVHESIHVNWIHSEKHTKRRM